MGQTAMCFNDRVCEYRVALSFSASGHLVIHCSRCGGTPEFVRPKILGSSRGGVAKEITEAYYVRRGDNGCVSAPSCFAG